MRYRRDSWKFRSLWKLWEGITSFAWSLNTEWKPLPVNTCFVLFTVMGMYYTLSPNVFAFSISFWCTFITYLMLLQVQNYNFNLECCCTCALKAKTLLLTQIVGQQHFSLLANALLSLSIHWNNNGNLCRYFVFIANNEKHLQKFPSFSEFSN